MKFLDFCIKQKIIPYSLPPHTTHRLQPLDISIFCLYKHQHQQKVYSSCCASDAQDAQDAQDTQDAQDVNSHSGCDVDLTARAEDSLNVPLRPDKVLKRTLRPVRPDAFRRYAIMS